MRLQLKIINRILPKRYSMWVFPFPLSQGGVKLECHNSQLTIFKMLSARIAHRTAARPCRASRTGSRDLWSSARCFPPRWWTPSATSCAARSESDSCSVRETHLSNLSARDIQRQVTWHRRITRHPPPEKNNTSSGCIYLEAAAKLQCEHDAQRKVWIWSI